MADYLAWDYEGGAFVLFGAAHWGAVLLLAAVGCILIVLGRAGDESRKQRLRTGLVIVLLVNELGWHAWNLAHGEWTPDRMLPLHLCGIMMWITIIVLGRGHRRMYPLLYFLGIAGAVQALITPDAGIYGFPHFRFMQTFIAHGGLVIAGFWVALVEHCRPTLKDAGRILLGLNVYAFLVWMVNSAIGSNYLYVNGKPEIATVLDAMPAWPWYIAILEVLAAGLMLLLWLPYARRRSERA